jgi:D-alanyl-D-alanine carboxypeptidase
MFALLIHLMQAIFGIGVQRLAHDPNVSYEVQEKEESDIRKAVQLPGAHPIVFEDENIIQDGGIWQLLNKENSFNDLAFRPDVDVPSIPVQDGINEDLTVARVALPDLSEMYQAAQNDGVDLMIGSAYRSYDDQKSLYQYYVSVNGQVNTDLFSSKPGYSEHQSGLAVDFTSPNQICRLETCWADQPGGLWLAENSWKFGWILRYPNGQDTKTGYMFEPWHYRYVGKPLASAYHQSGLATYEDVWPFIVDAMPTPSS